MQEMAPSTIEVDGNAHVRHVPGVVIKVSSHESDTFRGEGATAAGGWPD